ncbi:MAG: TetR family transcriptional regulator C-terminal domain-containing protein, partial [Pseudomonadota bacterium]|nr:TetR family transcriptional regulator C-terminal domain-containing protein [Pseudomonadota bacterium]
LADGLTESLKSTGHVAGCRYGNFAVELSTRDPVIREKVAATFQKIAAYFEQVIRNEIRAGELADNVDAEGRATAILSLMEGYMVLAIAQSDPEALRRLARDTVCLLVDNGYANERRRPH